VTSSILSATTKTINTDLFPDGTYVLKVISNGTITAQKVLIMRK